MRRSAICLIVCCGVVGLAGCSLFKKKPPASDLAVTDYSQPMEPVPSPELYGGGMQSYPTSGGGRVHTVAAKEGLYSIARQYYGDQSKWRTIYEANRAEIGDNPNKIRVGQRLTIP